MGYRYRAASIEGEWTSLTFSEKMLATLKDTATTKNKVSNALPQGQKSYHRYQYSNEYY